jgi:hypothetical protein
MKTILVDSLKKGIKFSFGFAFWFVFGGFILIAGMTNGIGLAIALSILFGAGYWTIKKVVKFFIKRGRQDAEQRKDKSIAGFN